MFILRTVVGNTMKLIVTIVDDQDADKVMAALTNQHIGVTRVSSTGGLLSSGNSTLLIGIDESKVTQVMAVITGLASTRQTVVPFAPDSSMPLASLVEVQAGGFMSFILDIEHFEQV